MRLLSLAILFGGLFSFTTGCNSQPANPANGAQGAKENDQQIKADVHAHASEGPHHGVLVELGKEEYHVEVTHDATSVTLYVLDSSAKQPVPIDASQVTINVLHDGAPEQFVLPASPDAADPAGSSSRFTLNDAELVGHLDDVSSAPKLSLTIAGTPYRGEIKHAHDGHDHSGHAHAH